MIPLTPLSWKAMEVLRTRHCVRFMSINDLLGDTASIGCFLTQLNDPALENFLTFTGDHAFLVQSCLILLEFLRPQPSFIGKCLAELMLIEFFNSCIISSGSLVHCFPTRGARLFSRM